MAVTVDNTKGAYTIPALSGSGYVPIGGGTMTGALTLPAGAVAAPSLNVATNTGLYRYGAANLGFAISGLECLVLSGSALYVTQGGASIQLTSTGSYGFSSGASPGTSDAILYRDAAATIAQRNGTNAQTLRVYSTYTDASNFERLSLSTTAGSSVNLTAETLGTGGDNIGMFFTSAGSGNFKFFNSSAQLAVEIYSSGYLVSKYGVSANNGGTPNLVQMFAVTGFSAVNSLGYGWTTSATDSNSAIDTSLMRGAAGQVDVTNGTAGTWRDLKLRNLLNTEYHQMTEMTAPSAPAANSVRIYAVDNGAGKTQLMALFASGAAQQIAIEP